MAHYGLKSDSTLRTWARDGRVRRERGRYWIDDGKEASVDDLPHAWPVSVDALRRAVPVQQNNPAPQERNGLEKWIVIPDCHVPFHHRANFSLMLRCAQAIGADNVAILGDFADFWAISFHGKDPARRKNLKWEIEEVNNALDMIDHNFRGKKKYAMGNHEYRWERYVSEKASEIFEMLSLVEMLRLKERGYHVTPYRQHTSIGSLAVTHEVGRAGKFAHYDALQTFQRSAVHGHNHHLGYTAERNIDGKVAVACALGWLGDEDGIDYMHRSKMRYWVQAFGIAYVEPDGNTHLVPVPILDGRAMVEGKVIR